MIGRCVSWNPFSDAQFACSSSSTSSSTEGSEANEFSTGAAETAAGSASTNVWEKLQVLHIEDVECDPIGTSMHGGEVSQRQQTFYSEKSADLVGKQGQFYRNSLLVDAEFNVPLISSLQWQPRSGSSVVAYGTGTGSVGVINWSSGQQSVVWEEPKVGERICNEVEWNIQNPRQLAAAFELSDFGAVIWDMEREVMLRTSAGESSSALSWLPLNPHLLAVGSTLSWIRVYDVRVSISGGGQQQQQAAVASIRAHPSQRTRKIRGIRPDPFRPHVFASFSDSAGDAVKIWDLRKLSTAAATAPAAAAATAANAARTNGQIFSVSPKSFASDSSGLAAAAAAESVLDVAWSPARPDLLAVLTSSMKEVCFYNTALYSSDSAAETSSSSNSGNSTSTPTYSLDLNEGAQTLAWKGSFERTMLSLWNLAQSASNSNSHSNLFCSGGKSSSSGGSYSSSSGGAAASATAVSSWEPYRVSSSMCSVLSSFITQDRSCGVTSSFQTVTRAEQQGGSMSHQRLLAASPLGFYELVVRDRIPMALSTAGLLATTGRTAAAIALSRENIFSWHAASVVHAFPSELRERGQFLYDCIDVCRVMRRRCRAGYSADASTNIDILTDELDFIHSMLQDPSSQSFQLNSNGGNSISSIRNATAAAVRGSSSGSSAAVDGSLRSDLARRAAAALSLYRTWLWVDRFETTIHEQTLELTNCGVLYILSGSNLKRTLPSDCLQKYHPLLGTVVYSSKNRELSKKLCGWIKVFGWSAAVPNSSAEILSGSGNGSSSNSGSGNSSSSNSGSGNSSSGNNGSGNSGSSRKQSVSESIAEEDYCDSIDETNNDLLEVIADELFLDSFERAAAISLWHGRIDLAVEVLKRALNQFTLQESSIEGSGVGPVQQQQQQHVQSIANSSAAVAVPALEAAAESTSDQHQRRMEWDEPITASYMQSISLAAMCLAGYPVQSEVTTAAVPAAVGGRVSIAPTWISMCKLVINQLEQSPRRSTKYLSAACLFLIANLLENTNQWSPWSVGSALLVSKSDAYLRIANDTNLALEDRIAFCCTYLPLGAAIDWLEQSRLFCAGGGVLEGVLITGLADTGIEIVQKYVDIYEDIQTAALLVCRAIDSSHIPDASVATSTGASSSNGNSSSELWKFAREWMWLYQYRGLLNRWEMFVERAFLDVELGKRHRKRSSGHHSSSRGSFPSNIASSSRAGAAQLPSVRSSGTAAAARQKSSKQRVYRLPAHSDCPNFFLRCGGCGVSLPVDGMHSIRPDKLDTLRRQKNVLNCCASCSRQLPRCYVCQLYMGMVNPYLEVNRIANQRRRDADLQLERENPSSRNRFVNTSTVSGGRGGSSGSSADSQEYHRGNKAEREDFEHNVVDFGKWFFFCQHCRHGGHANCIDQWFGGSGNVGSERSSTHEKVKRVVCGVNGCTCRCILRQ